MLYCPLRGRKARWAGRLAPPRPPKNQHQKAMTQHAVLHVEKSKGGHTGIGEHIDRLRQPQNADPSRAKLNEDLIQPKSKNLTNDINARIDEGYKKKKAIRKDAVKALKVVLTGSHDQMKALEKDKAKFTEWKEANLKFMSEKFGRENLVRFTLHMDETTPHIHAIVVPLTPDGELSTKKMLGGPKELAQLQTEYANAMKTFGLSRGKENSTAKHTDIKEYYGRVNNQDKLFPEVAIPTKGVFESSEAFQERAQKDLSPIFDAIDKAKRINGQLRGDNERLRKENSGLKQEISGLKSLGKDREKTEYERGCKDTTILIDKALEQRKLPLTVKLVNTPDGIKIKFDEFRKQEQEKKQDKNRGMGI